MRRALILFLGVLSALGACTQRTICPAFQSAYIYDRDELRKKFSYFQEDSTPKVLTASKNRYLVAEPTPYRKKLQSLQTVAMKPIPVVVPDSLLSKDSVSAEALDMAARSVIDSTFIPDLPATSMLEDSIYVITRDKELRLLKYDAPDSLIYDPVTGRHVPEKPAYYVKHVRLNVDQDNYMWYMRNYLVLPDVKLARQQQDASRSGDSKHSAKGKKEKKGLKGFFKDLFKKKPKASDSTDIPTPPRDEFDFIDVDTIARVTPPREQQVARKGLFAARKQRVENSGNSNTDARPGRRLSRTEAVKEDEDQPATEQGF